MTPEDFKFLFEQHYDVSITKPGMKVIYKLYSRFDADIIDEAFDCCTEQYYDGEEAFEKLGGICYNKSTQYVEYNE